MNILQIWDIQIPPKEGAAITIFKSFKDMVREGHSVRILCRKFNQCEPPSENINGLEVIRLNLNPILLNIRRKVKVWIFRVILSYLEDLRFGFATWKYLNKHDRFDVLHTYQLFTAFVLTLHKKTRTKLFYTSLAGEWFLPSLSLLEKLRFKVIEPFVMRRVKRAIAQNEIQREKFIEIGKINPIKTATVRHARVDLELFNPNVEEGDLKKKYNLEGEFVILYVGRIIKQKGIIYLVKSANIIVNTHGYKNAVFLIVGPIEQFGAQEVRHSKYLKEVKTLIEIYKLSQNVKLTGYVPFEDLRRLYLACDVFVLPSLFEAFPSVLSEAIASGKPLIGTKVGGIPLQIRDGWNGFLIEPGNEIELATAIKYLIEHPEERQRMGNNSRKLAESEFDSKKMAEDWIKAFTSRG